MRLAIISHTAHYRDGNNSIVGWSPTVREINNLSNHFEKIIHLGCFYNLPAPASATSYSSANVEFIPLPPFGSKKLVGKLNVIRTAPEIINKICSVAKDVDAIQLRLPTGMGNYLLPYFTFNRPEAKIWVKYAGDWSNDKAPLGFRFQKWWLKHNFLKCPVTINGHWNNQPANCHSFENPCIDEEERIAGLRLLKDKKFNKPLIGVFVGNLVTSKGVDRIIESIPVLEEKGFEEFHFVGGGDKLDYYKNVVDNLKSEVSVIFHDFIPRESISNIYSKSHIIILPSDSEGFPKVIAEAGNYGCVPIVSNVSSIPHYINDTNGYLWDLNKSNFRDWLIKQNLNELELINKALEVYKMAANFTYEHYYNKLVSKVLS